MSSPRALVVYRVDVDCCAPWLFKEATGKIADVSSISRGLFGANIGPVRMVPSFERHGVKGTFNTPGHTMESLPKQMAKVRDAGLTYTRGGDVLIVFNATTVACMAIIMNRRLRYELCTSVLDRLAYLVQLSEEQERDVLVKSIEVYEAFTNQHPKGYIAPNWSVSQHTLRLLEEHNIQYDHSLMAHDSQPHWAMDVGDEASTIYADFIKPATAWMKPMGKMKKRDVVEIPGNWDLTDFAGNSNFVPQAPNSHGYVSPHVIVSNWKEMFTWLYEDAKDKKRDSFLFPLTLHPQQW